MPPAEVGVATKSKKSSPSMASSSNDGRCFSEEGIVGGYSSTRLVEDGVRGEGGNWKRKVMKATEREKIFTLV